MRGILGVCSWLITLQVCGDYIRRTFPISCLLWLITSSCVKCVDNSSSNCVFVLSSFYTWSKGFSIFISWCAANFSSYDFLTAVRNGVHLLWGLSCSELLTWSSTVHKIISTLNPRWLCLPFTPNIFFSSDTLLVWVVMSRPWREVHKGNRMAFNVTTVFI